MVLNTTILGGGQSKQPLPTRWVQASRVREPDRYLELRKEESKPNVYIPQQKQERQRHKDRESAREIEALLGKQTSGISPGKQMK